MLSRKFASCTIKLQALKAVNQKCVFVQYFLRGKCTASLSNTLPVPEVETISLSFGALPRSPIVLKEVEKEAQKAAKTQIPLVLQQVRDFIDRYEGHVVLTQVGGFYELYFEQATLYASKMNLTLTSKRYVCGVIPFAGFPCHQLSKYIKILVQEYGHSVVIVDQFKKLRKVAISEVDMPKEQDIQDASKYSDDSSLKVMRRVSRIVTPGTLLDEAFENLSSSTYLLNIEFPTTAFTKTADHNMKLGISWTDISTGEIYVQKLYLKELVSAITRIKPSEILLDSRLIKYKIESGEWFPELVELKKYFISYYLKPTKHRSFDTFKHLFSLQESKKYASFILTLDFWEGPALKNLLTYIEDHLPEYSTNLQVPEKKSSDNIMQLDSRTSSALELHSTLRNNTIRGSLLSSIRRTVTTSGTRLLTQWVSAPLVDVEEINKRHSIVQFFKDNYSTLTSTMIGDYLKRIYDITKLLQKFSMNKGHHVELLQISHSLNTTKSLALFLKNKAIPLTGNPEVFEEILSGLQTNEKLVSKILDSIDEEKITNFMSKMEETSISSEKASSNAGYQSTLQTKLTNKEVFSPDWCIKPTASLKLRKLHNEYTQLLLEHDELIALTNQKLVKELGFRNVEFKILLTHGFVIQIGGSANLWKTVLNKKPIFPGLEFLQGKSTKKIFQFDAWTKLGYKLESNILRIREEEEAIIENFKKQFIEDSYSLRKTAAMLDYLDVLSSFAKLAVEKNLTRPLVDQSTDLDIRQGKHIVVEEGLLKNVVKRFTPNDCILADSEAKTWVITGPNMGGKSTFLRQNAIIVILAQVGSFVPCEYCRIGVVDKIFSRVGSADDLYNEMSTFMVEMIETNYILQDATPRSLAILDEVGRGTNGREGIAIAYGTLKHLISVNKCKTLFATHFGKELQKMTESDEMKGLAFYKTDLICNDSDDFDFQASVYDHKVKPGICTKSDALKVAFEAGFPKSALEFAQFALKTGNNI